jgi:elongation factor P
MDVSSYEETRLPRDDWANFLKEGATCELLFYNGKVGRIGGKKG